MSEAILATFSDFKTIKTRSTAQLIFEIPIEQADHALKMLGGIPQPGTERWCGIALAPKERKEIKSSPHVLPVKGVAQQSELETEPSNHGIARRPFASLPLSQQAGIRCEDQQFNDYLGLPSLEIHSALKISAAAIVREICGIVSRSELDTNDLAAQKWRKLETDFQAYLTDLRYAGTARL